MPRLEDHERLRILSVDNVIAWATKKDPNQSYEYGNVAGKCFFSQYLNENGAPNHLNSFNPSERQLWYELHKRFSCCVKPIPEYYQPRSPHCGQPPTFGQAVERLRERFVI